MELASTFVAPSCIPLLLLADVSDRAGPDSEENVGVSGSPPGILEPEDSVLSMLRPPGIGADVGRSMLAPPGVAIVL